RPGEPLAMGVDEPRRAVEGDGGLARPGAALDDEGRLEVVRDQPVLVGLDRRDDVAHPRVARPLELFQQVVGDTRAVARRAVKALVRDPEDLPALGAEAAAPANALPVDLRRAVEPP